MDERLLIDLMGIWVLCYHLGLFISKGRNFYRYADYLASEGKRLLFSASCKLGVLLRMAVWIGIPQWLGFKYAALFAAALIAAGIGARVCCYLMLWYPEKKR